MTNSKTKGKRGELEVARILKHHGYEARRGQQYKGGVDSPDVVGLPGVHIEVKRTEQFRLYDAMEQSEKDAADKEVPIVMHRRNGKPWTVIMDLDNFLDLYEMARMACYEGCSPIPERDFGTFKPW